MCQFLCLGKINALLPFLPVHVQLLPLLLLLQLLRARALSPSLSLLVLLPLFSPLNSISLTLRFSHFDFVKTVIKGLANRFVVYYQYHSDIKMYKTDFRYSYASFLNASFSPQLYLTHLKCFSSKQEHTLTETNLLL